VVIEHTLVMLHLHMEKNRFTGNRARTQQS
jgi:hypothetical protein